MQLPNQVPLLTSWGAWAVHAAVHMHCLFWEPCPGLMTMGYCAVPVLVGCAVCVCREGVPAAVWRVR